jgi:phage tail P2-like protein
MSDDDVLVPATAPDLARAIDAVEARLFRLPVHRISKDPRTVDEDLLDHLAWEASVDSWNLGWAPDVKRRVIAASEEVHLLKGTPYAVRRAVEAIGLRVDLEEWWQIAPPGAHGTFTVIVHAGLGVGSAPAVRVDEALIGLVNQTVRRVAPVSRSFGMRVRSTSPGPLALAAGASCSTRTRAKMSARAPASRRAAAFGLAAAVRGSSLTRCKMTVSGASA